MKHVIYGVLSIVLIVLVVVSLVTVAGRHTREQELKQALRQAVEESVDQVFIQGKYKLDSKEELVADFTSLLVERLHTKDAGQKLRVDIAGVDEQKGLLSVHVEEAYTHPNGRKGVVETETTIALEQEIRKAVYEIHYVIPQEICKAAQKSGTPLPTEYRSFILEEGCSMKAPLNPPGIGNKKFLSWADENGRTYTKSQLETLTVEHTMTLTAIYG